MFVLSQSIILKHNTHYFKKATNLAKFCFLPKILNRVSAAQGRQVLSNCGTPTEKVSRNLDQVLKRIIQES